MSDQTLSSNAQRMLQLFERMRGSQHGPEFDRLNELRISFSHVRAMHVLLTQGPLAMKDLAACLHLTPPTVTALVRRLVQSKLVERHVHSEDSRVSVVSLTTAGEELLDHLYQQRRRHMELLLQGLSADEQEQFLTLLERAVNALMQNNQDQPERPAC